MKLLRLIAKLHLADFDAFSSSWRMTTGLNTLPSFAMHPLREEARVLHETCSKTHTHTFSKLKIKVYSW